MMNAQFGVSDHHAEVVPSPPSQPRRVSLRGGRVNSASSRDADAKHLNEANSMMSLSSIKSSTRRRGSIKKQGSIRKLLFGKSSSSDASGVDSSSSSRVPPKRRKSFLHKKATSLDQLAGSGASAPTRLIRQRTFDSSMELSSSSSSSNHQMPARIQRQFHMRHSTPASVGRGGSSNDNLMNNRLPPTRQKSCSSRLPSRRRSFLGRSMSEKKLLRNSSFSSSSTRNLMSTRNSLVRFGDIQTATYDSDSRHSGWYTQKELEKTLDQELKMTVLSLGTTLYNDNKNVPQCCCRGIEQQLAGEDKYVKIRTYVKTILKAEAEIRKKHQLNNAASAGGSAASAGDEELFMISQILTKEDRTKACKMGFKDASEVRKMILTTTMEQEQEEQQQQHNHPNPHVPGQLASSYDRHNNTNQAGSSVPDSGAAAAASSSPLQALAA